MNENNDTNKLELTIKSYKIESNHDKDGTYSIEISTSAHTIKYPRAIVAFGANQLIAFPVGFQVLDDNGNVLLNYTLNLDKPNQEEQDQ